MCIRDSNKNYLTNHLENVIRLIERRSSVELIAIGIGYENSSYYRRSFNINDVEQLGPLMLSELSRLLIN